MRTHLLWAAIAALIGCPAFGALPVAGVDPLTVGFETRDAERFAALFERRHGRPNAADLQRGYLDGAGRGVAIFTPDRIVDAGHLAEAVGKEPERYRYAIATCLPLLPGLVGELRATYLAYRGLLPDRALPPIHIVFGAGNSGGTASPDAQVLGLEVMCGPGITAAQFRTAMRGIFAHETVHSWQRPFSPAASADPLLALALS